MPTPLIVIAAIVLLVLALLSLRLNLVLSYRDTVTLRLRVLCLRFWLYPRKKKFKKPKKRQKKGKIKHSGSAQVKSNEPALTLRESISLLRALAAAVIKKTNRHLKLRLSLIDVRVATGDAATTAVLYGAVSQSICYLIAFLSRVTAVRAHKNSVSVRADYLAERSSARIRLVFSISVWGLLLVLLSSSLAHIKARETLKKRRARRTRASATPHHSDTNA